MNKVLRKIKKNIRGFSMIELVVIIAIMAVLFLLIAPALFSHTERSRAQKDDSAMDELTNAIHLALAEPQIYDEVFQFAVQDNVSCYVDTNNESNYDKVVTKTQTNGLEQYTFTDSARLLDETSYFAAGNMTGVTITFAPNKSNNSSTFDLKQGVVNQYVQVHGNYRFGALENLYSRVSASIGQMVENTSQTYRNSEYTVFIIMNGTGGKEESKQDALQIYGQWSGTNLPADEVSYQIVTDRIVDEENKNINDEEWNDVNGSTPTINPGDLNGGGSFSADTETGNSPLKKDDFKVNEKDIYAYLVNGDTLVLRNSPKTDTSNVTKEYGKLANRYQKNWGDDALLIESVIIETPILPTNCQLWFDGFRNLKSINRIWNLCTDECSSMSGMFSNCESLINLDVTGFNTENVRAMNSMFYNCESLSALDVSGFNTSNVTNMATMFRYCESVQKLDVSKWDTSKVTNMMGMFQDCVSLSSLDVNNFDTSQVTNMGSMFSRTALTRLDLSNFNTENLTNMNSMFRESSQLIYLDVSSFNTSKVTNMGRTFWSCSKLQTIDVSGFDTSNVTDMSYMFVHCNAVESLDVSNWNTSNVVDMGSLFSYCKSLKSVDITNFDISNVTGMYGMFNHCEAITSIGDLNVINNWDVSRITNMDAIFSNCKKLSEKPIWC